MVGLDDAASCMAKNACGRELGLRESAAVGLGVVRGEVVDEEVRAEDAWAGGVWGWGLV